MSDATVKGEGEVKILGRIARHWAHNALEQDTHAILGDDADLVLMAMVCRQPQLLVINGALNDGNMAQDMPVFSVSRWVGHGLKPPIIGDAMRHFLTDRSLDSLPRLHTEWSTRLLPEDRSFLSKVGLGGHMDSTSAPGTWMSLSCPNPVCSLIPCTSSLMVQTDEELILGLKCDLALLTVIAKGNDYLPPVPGLSLETGVNT